MVLIYWFVRRRIRHFASHVWRWQHECALATVFVDCALRDRALRAGCARTNAAVGLRTTASGRHRAQRCGRAGSRLRAAATAARTRTAGGREKAFAVELVDRLRTLVTERPCTPC